MFTPTKHNKLSIYLSLFIILIITFISFSPVLNNSFVNWDDNVYVTDNVLIRDISPQKIKEIFSSYCSGNYHPLTLLTYAVETSFFGLDPKVFHTTNLALHLLNCIFVFWFIYLLTRNLIVCSTAALLFGIHPMRVETVSWISDRKDLLLCLFYAGSLITYVYYLKKKSLSLYLSSFLLFILCLLSKTMGVTLPIVLFLLDYFFSRKLDKKVFLEKLPFLCIAIIFGFIAFAARQSYQTELTEDLIDFTFLQAMLMGLYRLVFYYLFRIIAPFNISSFYPNSFGTNFLPQSSLIFSSLTILSAITGLILFSAKYTRKTVFGSLFFIITILPVFKVFNLGISADRFSYLPLIGIFFLAGEAAGFLFHKRKYRYLTTAVLVLVIIFYSVMTWKRCHVWKDSLSLITDTIKSYPTVPELRFRRGNIFFINKDYEKAVSDYSRTIALFPGHINAYIYRGLSYGEKGEAGLAVKDFTKALEKAPDSTEIYFYRAFAYYKQREFDKAWKDVMEIEDLGGKVNPEFIKLLEHYAERPEKNR